MDTNLKLQITYFKIFVITSGIPLLYPTNLFRVRFKEHLAHFRSGSSETSSVAQHILDTRPPISQKDTKVVKCVQNNDELNAYKRVYVISEK